MPTVTNSIFLLGVKYRQQIIAAFKLSYIGLFILTVAASMSVITRGLFRAQFFELAEEMAELGIIFYLLTLIPGIVRRFKKQYKIASLLMIYRRYIGILVFFTIFYHYMIERGISLLMTNISKWPNIFLEYSLFEFFGVAAFLCVFLLTVTSNDLSTSKLGVWWGRIHNLTYIIVWFMFFHVALQEINFWSLLLGIIGILQVSSFIYKWHKSQTVSSTK